MQLTAVYLKVPQDYIGFIEELPGVNLQEVVEMVLKANCVLANDTH